MSLVATDAIRRVPDPERDEEVLEEWEWRSAEPLIGGCASQLPRQRYPWQVSVGVMEFVRDNPLEAELREAIFRSLLEVAGVTDVAEEDREVWVVQGVPMGRELLEAVASAVAPLTDRVRAQYQSLPSGLPEPERSREPSSDRPINPLVGLPGVVDLDPTIGEEIIRRLRLKRGQQDE
jgi:hypothetical protein